MINGLTYDESMVDLKILSESKLNLEQATLAIRMLLKRINILEDELWPLKNPPRFKYGDKAIISRLTKVSYGIDPKTEGSEVIILNESSVNNQQRFYYISVSPPDKQIEVNVINEEFLHKAL